MKAHLPSRGISIQRNFFHLPFYSIVLSSDYKTFRFTFQYLFGMSGKSWLGVLFPPRFSFLSSCITSLKSVPFRFVLFRLRIRIKPSLSPRTPSHSPSPANQEPR
jgi:hypothetical protein